MLTESGFLRKRAGMAYLVGVLLCVAVVICAAVIGFDRERSFYSTMLMVIASYYVLFAAMGATQRILVLEIALAGGFGWIVQSVMPSGGAGIVLLGILAWPFVAFRSLYDHVAAVRDPLRAGNVEVIP